MAKKHKIRKLTDEKKVVYYPYTTSKAVYDSYFKLRLSEINESKVDKEDGKGLSTNDYTTAEQTKLAGIAEGAEVNVQADWNETDTTSDAYIKNTSNVITIDNAYLKLIIDGVNYADANGHEYVDLGITDSEGNHILWATCNVGAEEPDDAGWYIAWGELGTEEDGYVDGVKTAGYYYSNPKYYDSETNAYTKYNSEDAKTTLELTDDSANLNLAGDWRTPTYDEWEAINNTDNFTWTWDATNKGYTVTSKISGYEGKSIFLPAAGYRFSSRLRSTGSSGYYWSSSLDPSYSGYARYCYFGSDYHNACGYDYRYFGRSVRPVISLSIKRFVVEPSSEGTEGQALVTDGNGGRSWLSVIKPSETVGLVKNDGTIDATAYITSADVPTKLSAFENDSNFITSDNSITMTATLSDGTTKTYTIYGKENA